MTRTTRTNRPGQVSPPGHFDRLGQGPYKGPSVRVESNQRDSDKLKVSPSREVEERIGFSLTLEGAHHTSDPGGHRHLKLLLRRTTCGVWRSCRRFAISVMALKACQLASNSPLRIRMFHEYRGNRDGFGVADAQCGADANRLDVL